MFAPAEGALEKCFIEEEAMSTADYQALRLRREDALLVVIDIQERLQPHIENGAEVSRNAAILCRGAAALGIPVLVTEQYPQGLGPTVPEVADAAKEAGAEFFAKKKFSILTEEVLAALLAAGRRQIILCGTETHICVYQSCLDLLSEGYSVFLAADAVGSRQNSHRDLLWDQLRADGVRILPVESLLFECLDEAGSPEFKVISKLIK